MIVPDVNLLVFTYHRQSPYYQAARHWWEGLVNGTETIGLPWAVSMGFVRLMANPRVLVSPMSPSEALERVESWFQFSHVQPIDPEPEHLTICRSFSTLPLAARTWWQMRISLRSQSNTRRCCILTIRTSADSQASNGTILSNRLSDSWN